MFRTALRASLASLILAAVAPLPSQAEVVNEVILRVNDRIATLYDYLDRRSAMREEILRSDRLSPEDQERLLSSLSKRVMQQIFRDLLLESRADQLEIFVTTDEVEAEIQRMKERNGIETQEQLEQALASAGLNLERFRQEFESELRIQRLVGEEVRAKIDLDEDDLRRYYRAHPEEFRIPEKRETKEVVILDSSSLTEEEQRKLAGDIVSRLRAGETLEEVTSSYEGSEQVSSVIRLGWVAPGDLDETLEAALWSLEVGEVTDPIPGRGGLHILRLLDREGERLEEFAEVRDQIQVREQNRMFNEGLDNYLRELAQTAFIVERIPADAEGYRSAMAAPLREPFQILGESPSGAAEPASDSEAPAADQSAGAEDDGSSPPAR